MNLGERDEGRAASRRAFPPFHRFQREARLTDAAGPDERYRFPALNGASELPQFLAAPYKRNPDVHCMFSRHWTVFALNRIARPLRRNGPIHAADWIASRP